MKFYIVSDRYISYLKTIDGKVPDNYNGSRPFIGVVIEVNGVSYIAPLSSPKPQLERINNSKPTAFKIYNRKDGTEFLGVINLNYKTLEKEADDGEIEKIPMLKTFTPSSNPLMGKSG